jgi:hypothetical protein
LVQPTTLLLVTQEEATDAFYERVTEEIELALAGALPRSLAHWMVIEGADGIPTTCRLDDETAGMEVDEVLASHLSRGERAAAFVTVRGPFVLAQVLIAKPRNSDVRRASLTESSDGTRLGAWEGML